MNMPFLSSLQTRQILFYLTVICNLATCSFNATRLDDEMRLESGCRDTYPSYVTPYAITCRNMFVSDLPFHDNVTKMELVNVPLAVLNDTMIPKAIMSGRVGLRQLHWTKSHIKTLERITIPNLTELDLSWNIIQDVGPNAVRQLTILKKLNISHNSIERLPSNLFDERNSLTILSVSHNLLKTLPHTIFDSLRNLEILDLSNNHLSHLKESVFRQNTKLQNLNLSHNKLSMLPATIFHTLSSLQYLSLEDNHLFSLEPDTFIHLKELMVLNLGKNALWSLPSTLLPNNNTLFILTISHTRLQKIKLTALQNLRSLRSLQLTDNANLQNLPNETFYNLRNLKTIQLENNNFTQLPFSILDTQPEDLYLSGNPWPCDCSIQWIVFWALDTATRKNSLHLTGFCNDTNRDLLESLYQMQCRPIIVRISPKSYQNLEVNVHLECRAYAYPSPAVSWITPNGLVYIESDDANDPLRYHPALKIYQHLQTVKENVQLQVNGDLDIKRMTREDAGEYICIATNRMGESIAYTRLYVDPSIMQRIKTGSIICGLLWVNTFLLFSIVYLLIRRYTRRAKQEERTQRMQENMDVYKSQQILRLRERSRNQMRRIKNNCSIQVEWMKDNYKESTNNSQDHRASYLTNQYNEQMADIREYYLTQMHKARVYYEQQRDLILEFSVNRVCNTDGPTQVRPSTDTTDVLVKIENGATPTVVPTEDGEIYKYNDSMIKEIQKLTSLHNLHDVSTSETNLRPDPETLDVSASSSNGDRPTTSFDQTTEGLSNGKLRASEDEGDEKTSMLRNDAC